MLSKKRAWYRYLGNKTWSNHVLYIKERDNANKIKRRSYKDYERKIAVESKNNPKSFWHYVKSKTSIKEGIPPIKRDNGKTIATNEEAVMELNMFFSNVFTRDDTTNIPQLDVSQHNIGNITISKESVNKNSKQLNQANLQGPTIYIQRF